jgi:hypothetical protein
MQEILTSSLLNKQVINHVIDRSGPSPFGSGIARRTLVVLNNGLKVSIIEERGFACDGEWNGEYEAAVINGADDLEDPVNYLSIEDVIDLIHKTAER